MMNKSIFTTACSVFALSFIAPAFAMGGYGGGGGGMMGSGGMSMDNYSIAVGLIHNQKYAVAATYLDRALKANPRNANVLNYLGYTHRMLGDYPGSLDFYQRALAINPDHKGAHEYLGELYLMMHDSGSADGQLAELTRLCPDGCEEKDVLTKAIADYHVAAHAAATQATAPAQSTPSPQPAAPATQP